MRPDEYLYFAPSDIEAALERFSAEYAAKRVKEKIPYKQWRELKSATQELGIYVDESDVGPYLHFQKAIRQFGEIIPDPCNIMASFHIREDEFGKFFYEQFYTRHSGYTKNGKEKDMRISTTSDYPVCIWEAEKNHEWFIDHYGNYCYKNDGENCCWNTSTTTTCNEESKNKENEKEKDTMKGFNFNFGPCTGDNIKMSVYGLAIQNANGEWVSYDSKSGQIMNVDLLNFDGRKFMFKMPVAIKDIAKGDIVIHNKVPMFVLDIKDGGVIAVDVRAGEEKKILPTNSPFGFNFVTKVVSMFNAFNGAPTPDTPFGNFLPFMMMGESNDIDPFVMCMMMQNMGGTDATNVFSNPMMMYLFMKDGKADKDFVLPMLMMQNMGQTHSATSASK